MQNSRIERRVGLKRHKPIARQSAKKKREQRETEAIRYPYIDAGLPCQRCYEVPAAHPHEITAGAHRHRAVYQPDAQLYLCEDCHEIVQGIPYADQVTIGVVARVKAVNLCHGSQAVTVGDVIAALVEMEAA